MSITASHLLVANLILFSGLALAVFAWLRARHQARLWQRLHLRHERDHCDERRKLNIELERALRARSTFLAAANHDLRQPLQALFCFSAILSGRVRGQTRVVADQMQACLQVLNGHLESLVELSRLDAGIVEPAPMTLALDDVLRDVRATFAPLAAAKGLRFLTAPAGRIAGRSDPAMLRRIVHNLVDNAVRFTHTGGVVVGCRRRGDSVRIEIWDSGVGIAAEQLAHVFDEFYQVGNSQRDRVNGLGLGLAVVDRLVQMLPDHRLEARSEPGRGSVFAVDLPIAKPVRASGSIVRGPWDGLRNHRAPSMLRLGIG